MPCLEGATWFPAPNLGLMDVPALEPMEFLLLLGSVLIPLIQIQLFKKYYYQIWFFPH